MRNRTLLYWLCQIAGWCSWSVLGLSYALAGGYQLEWRYAVIFGSTVVISIAWTHVYRRQIKRRGWAALGPGKLLARAIPASLALGILIPYTNLPVYAIVLPGDVELVGRWTWPAIMGSSWNALAWNFAYFAIHYFERWRQAEVDKLRLAVVAAEATLHGLMSQLNPHFLFNCLNSVRALIVEDPAKAQTAVTQLSDLMRYSMQASRIATVPLETELAMVRTYLSLEAIRLDERLVHTFDIADDARAVPIPTMLVQSLVENGVKHGLEQLPAGGTIAIAAWRADGAMHVRVTNTGQITRRPGSTQVGLANAHERLRLLYGARAALVLQEAGGSVVAELTVPVVAELAAPVATEGA